MAQYEIRIRGHLSPSVAATFEGLRVKLEPAESVIQGRLLDEAALYGVLDHVQDLGLELVEVRQIDGRGSMRRS